MHHFTSAGRKRFISSPLAAALFTVAVAGFVVIGFSFVNVAQADSVSINFENPPYTLGTINGQDGWTALGSVGSGCAVYDEGVSNSLSTSGFGNQSFRISNAVTSGCFGDQAFAKPLVNAVGETAATAGTFSSGTRQSHFEMEFDIASANPTGEQRDLKISVSPDRGDGSRMSYLRFEDERTLVHVFFVDVQGTSNPANFVETEIATFRHDVPHHIKLTFDAIDGPSNDVVKVWIDRDLKITGTSWENYYRYDSEASAEQSPRIVKTVLFRAGGTASPATRGKGFLIDNLTLVSSASPIPPTDKEQCKNNGWEIFPNPVFKNQGDCVSYVEHLPKLTIVKNVINDNGGTKQVSDFTLSVGGTQVQSGVQNTFVPGTYTVSESGHAGYAQSFSEDCPNGSITLAPGDSKTCTITNDDIAPGLRLVKSVSGGDAVASNWTLTATGASSTPTNLSGQGLASSTATFAADTYTLAETGGPGHYTASDWTCTGVQNSGNTITLGLGQRAECTITNTYQTPEQPKAATCPAGTTPTLVETDTVNSSSLTATVGSNNLLNGQPYLLVSSGTWQNNSLNVADTAYASVDGWATHMQGYNITPYFLGTNEFQLQVGGSFVNWGAYSPAHQYSYLYTGTGTPVNLMVFDGDSTAQNPVPNPAWYGDNSGNLSVNVYHCDPLTPKSLIVHILKYLDGVLATASATGGASFPMAASWNAANIGAGSGSFPLGPTGFNSWIPYTASTTDMSVPADYSVNEVTGGDILEPGAQCSPGKFQLTGYQTGDTLAAAEAATPTAQSPALTGLTADKYVIVANHKCPDCGSHELTLVSDTSTLAGNNPAVLAWVHPNWTTIPGASWIWSTYEVADPRNGETVTFTKTFDVIGRPSSAQLQIAADNSFYVLINGTMVATSSAIDNFSTATSSDVLSAIHTGSNTMTITVTNWAWNTDDPHVNPAGLLYKLSITSNDCPLPPSYLKVHIFKYLQDGDANAQVPDSADITPFPMTATWQTANLNSGSVASGNYTLGTNYGGAVLKYAADTASMQAPADYATNEVTSTDGQVLPPETQCVPGKYQLVGYKTGTSLAEAQGAAVTTATPAFTKISSDGYVIVVNKLCPADPTPQAATVTLCKVNRSETPQAGWQLNLLGDKVDTANVFPDGNDYYFSGPGLGLALGDYVLLAHGQYIYRPGEMTASTSDAAYSLRLPSDSVYGGPYVPWVRENDFPSPNTGWLGIQVSHSFTDWGSIFNPDHVYALGYTHTGGPSPMFRILDDQYGDNSGKLSVDIYKGWTKKTGENGCATFTNVPYGTYTVGEVGRPGWSPVSGLGQVTVNEPQKTVTVVNDDGAGISINTVDVCPNLEGIQASVPENYHLSDGVCVKNESGNDTNTGDHNNLPDNQPSGPNNPPVGNGPLGPLGLGGSVGGGQVLGASIGPDTLNKCVNEDPYITSYLRLGGSNNTEDVIRLQTFLNSWLGAKLTVSGVFDQATFEAVKRFQELLGTLVLVPWTTAGHPTGGPTGYVYKTTKFWINVLNCPLFAQSTPFPNLP